MISLSAKHVKIGSVCASNNNRSMFAHAYLQRKGFSVYSYGTGRNVTLPGERIDRPNIYEFGTPYRAMIEDLRKKNEEHYRAIGLLDQLERNALIKNAPEKFQITDFVGNADIQTDVIICYETRVFDAVIDDFIERGSVLMKPVHVINLNTRDDYAHARLGALQTNQFLESLIKLIIKDYAGIIIENDDSVGMLSPAMVEKISYIDWNHAIQEKIEVALQEFADTINEVGDELRYLMVYY